MNQTGDPDDSDFLAGIFGKTERLNRLNPNKTLWQTTFKLCPTAQVPSYFRNFTHYWAVTLIWRRTIFAKYSHISRYISPIQYRQSMFYLSIFWLSRIFSKSSHWSRRVPHHGSNWEGGHFVISHQLDKAIAHFSFCSNPILGHHLTFNVSDIECQLLNVTIS